MLVNHLQLAGANAHGKPRPRLELDSAVAAAPEAAQQLAEVLSPAAKAVADTARADKAEAAIAGGRHSAAGKAAAAPGAGQLPANAAAELKSENIAKELKSENSATAGSGSGGGQQRQQQRPWQGQQPACQAAVAWRHPWPDPEQSQRC